jgi:hypothetical protein
MRAGGSRRGTCGRVANPGTPASARPAEFHSPRDAGCSYNRAVRKTFSPPVPASVTDRTYWSRVAREVRFAPWRETVEAVARGAAPQAPSLTATDYLAARRYNDRRRSDRVWQKDRAVVSALAAVRAMEGFDPACRTARGDFAGQDDRLLDWLWTLLNMPTWAGVNHLARRDLPDLARPVTLDLAACEMALAMAEAVEILRPWMDAVSDTLAGSILHEVRRRVIEPFARPGTPDGDPWWAVPEKIVNNWTGVCAGSILGACASFERQGLADRAVRAARRRAVATLALYLRQGFTDEGDCEEGMSYWAYGLQLACSGWMRLPPAAFRRTVDIGRLAQVAGYARRAHLFGDVFYAKGDAKFVPPGLGWAWWLARMTDDEWLAGWCRARGGVAPAKAILPWRELAAMDDMAASPLGRSDWPAGGDPSPHRRLPDQQVAIFRARAAGRELIATLAGGDNGVSHNHNDVGHVNLWADGRPVLVDLGCPDYTADFFGPNRYTHLSAGSEGHNVARVNGRPQRPGRSAAARVLDWRGDAFELELAAAYPEEARLSSWTRRLSPQDDGLRLEDVFECSGGGEVVLQFWSPEKPAVDASGRVSLGPVDLRLAPPPSELRVVSIRAGDHRLLDYAPSRRLYNVLARYPVPPCAPGRIRTRIAPAPRPARTRL